MYVLRSDIRAGYGLVFRFNLSIYAVSTISGDMIDYVQWVIT
jgi:hypothetical protein